MFGGDGEEKVLNSSITLSSTPSDISILSHRIFMAMPDGSKRIWNLPEVVSR